MSGDKIGFRASLVVINANGVNKRQYDPHCGHRHTNTVVFKLVAVFLLLGQKSSHGDDHKWQDDTSCN